jgi:prevent-host-death family protein
MDTLFPQTSIEISALKSKLDTVVKSTESPVDILDNGKPVALIVPVGLWDAICEELEDAALVRIAKERLADATGKTVAVKIEDL